jgi:ribokinase
MRENKVLAVGAAYVDINCPNFPLDSRGLLSDTEIVGSEYLVAAGGSAVNFTRLCRSLGLASQLIAKVGTDAFGSLLSDLLRTAGVEPNLIIDRSCKTNVSMNLTDHFGRSIMLVVGSANQSLDPAEVEERVAETLAAASYFYIGGCFKLARLLPAFEQLVILAKSSGTKVVVDHGRLNSAVTETDMGIVRRLVKRADYYLPSRKELLALWGADSIENCLRSLDSALNGTIVVVKDGGRGAVTMQDNRIFNVPAFSVTPIHGIGAGDAFNAGFIAKMAESGALLEGVRFGCATAALSISSDVLPNLDSVSNFMQNQE